MIDLDAIRDGLTKKEFFLEYLPTISLVDGRCVGAEALIRWRRGNEIVPPLDFIPLAENTPLSGLITYWVIDTVADEMGEWLRANPGAQIGINVPPEILGRGGLEYAATKSGLVEVLSQVMIEITERGIPDQLGVEAINQGTARGLKVALDDVALLGGANLAILSRCKLHAIKLAKSLIDEIDPERPAPAWLESVTGFLGSSQLQVIAEGVDTNHQASTLRAANVQAAQGFYFSRPLSATAFRQFHERNGPHP